MPNPAWEICPILPFPAIGKARRHCGGATTEQIAAHLNLSVKTVQNYHYLIKTKTGARTDAQLVRVAATCGLTRI
jgi:DNA-binding CsgD family transcriptional regulator